MKFIAKNMNVTPADVQLLWYLHAVKVSTYEQIKRDIYSDYHFASVCNRIYRLERNGLVCGNRNRVLASGKRYISLTRKGFDEFVAKGNEVHIELKSDAVNHDLELVDIRYCMLKASRVLQYHSENELQTWGINQSEIVGQFINLNSDAVLLLRFPKGEIICPLEYELNGKSIDRYEPLIKKYYRRDDVPLVLYLCNSKEVMNRISKIEKKLFQSDQPKFFYKVMQKIATSDELSFHNYNDRILTLHQPTGYEQVTK